MPRTFVVMTMTSKNMPAPAQTVSTTGNEHNVGVRKPTSYQGIRYQSVSKSLWRVRSAT